MLKNFVNSYFFGAGEEENDRSHLSQSAIEDNAPCKTKLVTLRPGIIEILDGYHERYPYASFTSDDIDSRYSNSRIGSNARVLADLGLLEIVNEGTVGSNRYRYLADDLGPAEELAEEAYRYRIISGLEKLSEESIVVTGELDEGLLEDRNGVLKRERYSDPTLEFLTDISIIDSVRDPGFVAEPYDIEFLDQRTQEWELISESLLETGELPEEHRMEKDRFPPR